MAINIVYGPNAATLGSVAEQAGYGQFLQKQQQQKLEEAKFQADQFMRANEFMARQQQQAVENSMRAQQMDMQMWRESQQLGMEAMKFQSQQNMGWYDRAVDTYFKNANLDWQKAKEDSRDQWEREKQQNELDYKYSALDQRTQNYQALNDTKQAIEEMKTNRAIEVAQLKFDNRQQQELNKLDGLEAGISAQIQAGDLSPKAQGKLIEIQARREAIYGEARRTTIASQEAQKFDIEKDWNSRSITDEFGNRFTRNHNGDWTKIHDQQAEDLKLYKEAEAALIREGRAKGDETAPDAIDIARRVDKMKQGIKMMREGNLPEPPQSGGMLSGMARDLVANAGQTSNEPPSGLGSYGMDSSGKPGSLFGSQTPVPSAPSPSPGSAPEPQANLAPGFKSSYEQRQAAFQELDKARAGASPEFGREIDMVIQAMSRYPNLMDAPPDVRARVKEVLKKLGV